MLTIVRCTTIALVLGVLAAGPSAQAQPPHVARVGVIASGTLASSVASVGAFRQRLRELGYVEGQSIAIEVRYADEIRYADAQPKRYRDIAAELVGRGVDVIVASGTLATRGAKEVTSAIPIVMVSSGDAVAAGLVTSLPRPGGNVTGQSFMGPELAVKGFDLLMEVLPRAKRVGAVFNPEIARGEPIGLIGIRTSAKAKGVTVQPVEVRRPDDLAQALAGMGVARLNGLLVFALNVAQLSPIVDLVAKNRLPAVYGFREAVEAGGLMSFGPKSSALWRGAAGYVDRILKGAKPGDLPVEQPTAFELVLNERTAKALGLTIPASVQARADQIIE